jgi:hypothetical protein
MDFILGDRSADLRGPASAIVGQFRGLIEPKAQREVACKRLRIQRVAMIFFFLLRMRRQIINTKPNRLTRRHF